MAAGFFASTRYAVVGASANKAKFGNRVLCWYMEHGLSVVPVNPVAQEIEGLPCAKSLSDMEGANDSIKMRATSVSVVTPPSVSEAVLREIAKLGIQHVWFQPGSEPPNMTALAKELGIHVIGNGACILKEGQSLMKQQAVL
ncbi:hypothetical protein IWW36_001621 [Coemansia brasiliensis]|uniref:CoA-binding domain-containing protein n=1 Tax=Coemansia brasiliensis TaxID=2650707 RepID=A0A9W8M1D6_9FUNG|nr:hypothetical protein IWW36_001621 [Coemansia brasiliensis]